MGMRTRTGRRSRTRIELDLAGVSFDDATADVEAETGALADILGGEERLEDSVQTPLDRYPARCR